MFKVALFSFLAAALAGLGGCGAGGVFDGVAKPGDAAPGASMTVAERSLAVEVLTLVNREREAEGLEPLVWDEEVADVAFDHCVDMRLRAYVSHRNPEGLDGYMRLRDRGVDMLSAGENIAQGHKSPAAVVAAWMGSAGHRAAILNPGYTRCGIGVHVANAGPWWTQDFVAPPLRR